MAANSKIEWTDATWNPIRAKNLETGGYGHFCVRVSDGCRNCYAERMQPRFQNPIRYAARDHGKVAITIDEKHLTQPLSWKKPRIIFVCSMTDLFGDWVSDEMLYDIFEVINKCPQHQFLVLTKRPLRMKYHLDWGVEKTPLNVWLGVSVEDQKTADPRISFLRRTLANRRFVSYEPALGPVDFGDLAGIDWVICGGESGPAARPMHPDWARSARDQCDAAGVPFFFKQWGAWASVSEVEGEGAHFTFPDHATVRRVGKHHAGNTLDGVKHLENPPAYMLPEKKV